MIYTHKKGNLAELKQAPFKLERELQTFVEENLKSLFNLTFLASEYRLNNFRLDTLAFDTFENTFMVIEYKKGKNESLVDQGYAYLNTVLDRKSELVLLYNKVFNTSKQIEDFTWGNTRVYFISPSFTEYQKAATESRQMPFYLYELKRYEGELYTVNEINSQKNVDTPKGLINPEMSGNVAKEVIVYAEEDRLSDIPEKYVSLYYLIKERILELDNFIVKPTKFYIGFKLGTKNIVDIKLYKSFVRVFLNIGVGALNDPYKKARDISNVGTQGNGNYQIDIHEEDELDYLMTLIKQTHKYNVG